MKKYTFFNKINYIVTVETINQAVICTWVYNGSHVSLNNTSLNTPVTGAYYTPEQGKVIQCLNN